MSKLSPEEIKEILETYTWIKVKRYEDDPSLPAEQRYARLEVHHERETKFLIEFIRKLVAK